MCGKCSKDHYIRYPEHNCSNTDINGIITNANYEYIFESDRGYFLDDRARLIKSSSGYGKLPAFEGKTGLRDREIFSDTLGRVCSVETEDFDWKKDRKPFVKATDMIIYKLHVRGFTVHESSKIKHPGTFKGVTEKIP